jgi:4-hydroxy-2-oxoheptanedioate aldolase
MAEIVIHNRVRELLKQGKVAYGLSSFTNHPAFIEIMGWAGFDCVFIDTEHAPQDVGGTLAAVRACQLTGMTPIVRVYENSPPLVCKALDNGAQGVIFPFIKTPSQAEAAVRSAKYPPLGDRGVCPYNRGAHYGLLSWKEYYQKANEDTLVILIIEDAEGVKNARHILKIKGIDIIYFGPGDYSQSIGLPGETYEHPKIFGALKDMVKMCNEVGVSVMTNPGMPPVPTSTKSPSFELSDVSHIKKIVDAGVKLVAIGSDVALFRESCRDLVKKSERV